MPDLLGTALLGPLAQAIKEQLERQKQNEASPSPQDNFRRVLQLVEGLADITSSQINQPGQQARPMLPQSPRQSTEEERSTTTQVNLPASLLLDPEQLQTLLQIREKLAEEQRRRAEEEARRLFPKPLNVALGEAASRLITSGAQDVAHGGVGGKFAGIGKILGGALSTLPYMLMSMGGRAATPADYYNQLREYIESASDISDTDDIIRTLIRTQSREETRSGGELTEPQIDQKVERAIGDAYARARISVNRNTERLEGIAEKIASEFAPTLQNLTEGRGKTLFEFPKPINLQIFGAYVKDASADEVAGRVASRLRNRGFNAVRSNDGKNVQINGVSLDYTVVKEQETGQRMTDVKGTGGARQEQAIQRQQSLRISFFLPGDQRSIHTTTKTVSMDITRGEEEPGERQRISQARRDEDNLRTATINKFLLDFNIRLPETTIVNIVTGRFPFETRGITHDPTIKHPVDMQSKKGREFKSLEGALSAIEDEAVGIFSQYNKHEAASRASRQKPIQPKPIFDVSFDNDYKISLTPYGKNLKDTNPGQFGEFVRYIIGKTLIQGPRLADAELLGRVINKEEPYRAYGVEFAAALHKAMDEETREAVKKAFLKMSF